MIDKARSGARSEALQWFKLKCWDADRVGGNAIGAEMSWLAENEVVGE